MIANCDDVNTMDALRGIERKVITFGLSPKADVYAENIMHRGSSPSLIFITGEICLPM